MLLSNLLLAGEEASPTITRADMCELAAAASLLALDGIDVDTLHMPNVPKGERSGSVPGIDAMAAFLDEDGEASSFSDDEFVVMCSAKHTIADAGDLRRKVVASLDEEEALTMPYVAGRLRRLEGRLAERGIDARRVYLALSDFPDPEFVRLVGVGVVPLDMQSQQVAGLRHLPPDTSGCRHFRCLAVADLGLLMKRS